MSKISNWHLQLQEDAEHMNLNEFISEHGDSQQIVDVWTSKQIEIIEGDI